MALNEDALRDPKATPYPGDRFRFRNGNDLEVTGVVISVTKNGIESEWLYVSRFVSGELRRTVVPVGAFQYQIKTAEVSARGGEVDPWKNAERRPASEVSGSPQSRS